MTARRPDMPSQADDPLVPNACVDESIRVAGPGEGVYVLAAAVTHVSHHFRSAVIPRIHSGWIP